MKKLFAILLAGLAFTACQKDDSTGAGFIFDTPTVTAVSATTATLSCGAVAGAALLDAFTIQFAYGTEADDLAAYARFSDVQVQDGLVTAHLTGLQPETHYKFYVIADAGSTHRQSPIADFTTEEAGDSMFAPVFEMPVVSDVTKEGATLACTFTYDGTETVDAVYFTYMDAAGTEQKVDVSTETGAKTATLTGLTASTEYVFRLCVEVDGEVYKSAEVNFTTLSADTADVLKTGWLELPATTTGTDLITMPFYVNGSTRNYTMLYDKSKYTAYWVAYPLVQDYIGGNRYKGNWKWTPDIDQSFQIDLRTHSYDSDGTTLPGGSTANLPANELYARGHQCPDADRSGNPDMQVQTYYCTNSTPQLQNGFNGGIWEKLEDDGVRGALNTMPSTDTLYVVTGAIFSKTTETKAVTYIHAKDDTKEVPVPNYYYKVLLKCKRDAGGNITDASTVGFWFEHKSYSGTGAQWSDAAFAASVDQIEQYTGFDFFANLPDEIEAAAEQNSNYNTFKAF